MTEYRVGQRVFLPGEDIRGVIGGIERKEVLSIRTDEKQPDNSQYVTRHSYYAVPETPTSKLSTYIFCNCDPDPQHACTQTAYAVDELLAGKTREQLVSVQTQVVPVVSPDSPTLFLCTTTVIVEEVQDGR